MISFNEACVTSIRYKKHSLHEIRLRQLAYSLSNFSYKKEEEIFSSFETVDKMANSISNMTYYYERTRDIFMKI
jgi:hypothetical protein